MQIKDIKNMSLQELLQHEEWLKEQVKLARKAESVKKKENERALNKQRNHRLIVIGGGVDRILKQSIEETHLADLEKEQFDRLVAAWETYLDRYSVIISQLLTEAIRDADDEAAGSEQTDESEDTFDTSVPGWMMPDDSETPTGE